MIWETPFKFRPIADKSIPTYVNQKLQEYVKDTPDKKVLISAENNSNFLTYTQLLDQIRAVEVFLDTAGFNKGDVAVAYMPNNIECVPFYLAVLGRGGIFLGISPLCTKYEVRDRLSDSNSSIVFTTKSLLENLFYSNEHMDHSVKIIVLDDFSSEEVVAWSDVIKTEGEPAKRVVDIHDIAILPYSSGTTGLPKGVMLSHNNLFSVVLNIAAHGVEHVPHPENTDSTWDCTQLQTFPCIHISGIYLSLTSLITGSTIVMLADFDLLLYLKTIENFKIWNLVLSPPIILELVKDPRVRNYDLSSLGYATCGGAPLGAELAEEFLKKFPEITVTQIYGMSECLCPFLAFGDRRGNYATVGCVAPGFQAKIIDLELGTSLGPNETGELVIKGPSVLQGYINRPQATKEAFDEYGWFRTGDVGYINDNGELFIVDRIKDMIKIGTDKVAPAEIESILSSDPRIKDVGAVGTGHPKFGEIPCVFVVKSDPELSENNVERLIKERLGCYKWPEGIIMFVNKIPKLPSGKILRRQLKELIV